LWEEQQNFYEKGTGVSLLTTALSNLARLANVLTLGTYYKNKGDANNFYTITTRLPSRSSREELKMWYMQRPASNIELVAKYLLVATIWSRCHIKCLAWDLDHDYIYTSNTNVRRFELPSAGAFGNAMQRTTHIHLVLHRSLAPHRFGSLAGTAPHLESLYLEYTDGGMPLPCTTECFRHSENFKKVRRVGLVGFRAGFTDLIALLESTRGTLQMLILDNIVLSHLGDWYAVLLSLITYESLEYLHLGALRTLIDLTSCFALDGLNDRTSFRGRTTVRQGLRAILSNWTPIPVCPMSPVPLTLRRTFQDEDEVDDHLAKD